MTTGAAAGVRMPGRLRALPRDGQGLPIPWFVDDGEPAQYRVPGADRRVRALRDKLCWACGQKLPGLVAFVFGPTAVIERSAPDPPMHEQCAEYTVRTCPAFCVAARPDRPAGAVLWTTDRFAMRAPRFPMPGSGVRLAVGPPVRVTWWTGGRAATRGEAAVLLAVGYGQLQRECEIDPDPRSARAVLERKLRAAEQTLPPQRPLPRVR